MQLKLDQSLSSLPGVGYRMSTNLKNLRLESIRDLIWHFPHRYDDFRNVGVVSEIELDTPVTLTGQIWTIKNIFTRNRKRLTQAIFNDGTNSIDLVWFNSHWITNQLKAGDQIRISGKVTRAKNRLSMTMPVWEKVEQLTADPSASPDEASGLPLTAGAGSINGIHTGRLVPIYPETSGITSKWLRGWVAKLLPEIEQELAETLPDEIRGDKLGLREAISEMHFPTDLEKLDLAHKRLAFEELFYIQLATSKVRREWQAERLIEPIQIEKEAIEEFINTLSFSLTNAQKRVLEATLEDLKRNHPMNRLIQGDVGSGKTVVAAALMYAMHRKGWRSMLMAPTEVLASQHYQVLKMWFDPLGVKVGIQTGSEKSIKNKELGIQNKEFRMRNKELGYDESNSDSLPDVVVGTHALIAKKFSLEKVGLVVVDEQHRFGVNQRNILRETAEIPHFLSMTATPIPRTVALTMYGDLDISIIDEMPSNRIPVKTYLVPKHKRADSYKFIDQQIGEGDQVYVVVPLIEESENLMSVKAVKSEFENLKKIFPKRRIGLLHGRLTSIEKNKVLEQFKNRKLDILVSTSVVEVGVDVPNATVMVIEGAERFGLASLHQLRGRVGRGDKESVCLLFMSEESEVETVRLKTLTQTNNGLVLAELDLKIRGGGEVFGKKQSGRFELKVASLADVEMIEEARSMANRVLDADSRLDNYPTFKLKLEELISSPSPD